MKILAHEVESIQEFFGSLLSTQKVCEMKVGNNDTGLMRLLRKTAKPIPGKPPQVTRQEGLASWRFLTYDVAHSPDQSAIVLQRQSLGVLPLMLGPILIPQASMSP
jgi:hypothetical protein